MSWPWPFLRIAHRGIPTRAPANSLEGFALAMTLGADMVETDLRASADGALVLAHDEALAPPGQRPVPIATTTLEALRRLAGNGAPLATLDEALTQRHHGAPLTFNLDIKVSGIATALLAALRRAGRREGILLTGNAAPGGGTFAAVRATEPWVVAALSLSADLRQSPLCAALRPLPWSGGLIGHRLVAAARAVGTSALTIEHTLASRPAIEVCHAAGLHVLVWTVDDPRRMRALQTMGVDGITTNAVDVLAGVGRSR